MDSGCSTVGIEKILFDCELLCEEASATLSYITGHLSEEQEQIIGILSDTTEGVSMVMSIEL